MSIRLQQRLERGGGGGGISQHPFLQTHQPRAERTCHFNWQVLNSALGSSGMLSATSATSFLMPGNLESHWGRRNKTEIEDFCWLLNWGLPLLFVGCLKIIHSSRVTAGLNLWVCCIYLAVPGGVIATFSLGLWGFNSRRTMPVFKIRVKFHWRSQIVVFFFFKLTFSLLKAVCQTCQGFPPATPPRSVPLRVSAEIRENSKSCCCGCHCCKVCGAAEQWKDHPGSLLGSLSLSLWASPQALFC